MSTFTTFLKLKRKSLSEGARKRIKTYKFEKAKYPFKYEKQFAEEIRKWLQGIIRRFKTKNFKELYEFWLREEKKDAVDYYTDSFFDQLRQQIKQVEEEVEQDIGKQDDDPEETEIGNLLLVVALGIEQLTKKGFDKRIEKVIGVAVGIDPTIIEEAIKAWVANNKKYLKNYADNIITRIQQIVKDGVTNGLRWEEISKQLQKELDKAKGKANLLARDQVGKFNGELQKARNQAAGINFYNWQTMKDERVRGRPSGKYPNAIPSHWKMDGLLCDWRDSSIYSDNNGKTWKPRTTDMPMVHVGQAINCRCTSLPFVDNLIEEADKQI